MRILRVAQTVYPEVKGGGAYHVHAMSRDQAAMGHDVTVLTLSRGVDEPHRERRDGYDIVRYPVTTSALGNDISLGVASFLRDAHSFDVIHAHSHLYFSTNLAALKRRLGDIPLAITNHGLYSQNAPKWLFDLYLRSVGRWTFNQADVVFCYTETDKQRVGDLGVSSHIEVVPNGIDTNRFTPDGPKSNLIDADGPVVLFVGRLVEGKRPSDVIQAVATVQEEYPDVELYLCGEGSLSDELEELIENLDVDEAVRFLGHVPYDEMPKVYRSADVLVLPSRAEGLPRTVLEAQSSGISVVTSDLEQISDALGPNGQTFEGGNVMDLSNVLARVVGQNQSDQTAEVQSWESTVELTTDHLRAVIRRM
ncbi:glycosyltransferase family 4 protein [Haloprofundus halobius]|uniref:glycosyltransferase family 4 protein n=1 Tax=Haloprofundus halobius TaxID=2876194 RepID=UPI001CCF0E23|nr:glycosyltransferase family 4 protein [Haloprofundus halobius]